MAVKNSKIAWKCLYVILLASFAPLEVDALELMGMLEQDGADYKLATTFTTVNLNTPNKGFLSDKWAFTTKTLSPAFSTARFNCVIDNVRKTDGCNDWRDKEDRFVYVNSFTSSYGDTPNEREAKESNKLTAGKAVKAVAGTAIMGVVYGPMLVVMSPFLLVGKAIEKETKKWVEFNHDDFAKALDSALKKSGFSNRQEFLERQEQVVRMLERQDKHNSLEFNSLNQRIETERESMAKYVKAGFHSDAYIFKLKKLSIPDAPVEKSSDSTFEASANALIEPYYTQEYAQFSAVLTKENAILKPQYEARLKQDAIDEAERTKQANLDEKMRVKQEKIDMEELRKRQQLEAGRLAKYRKGLKLGDDTFCGPVIDMRGPMVKVAVNAPLPGYASEVWLKTAEIYTPEYGCSNRNGRLSPSMNVY